MDKARFLGYNGKTNVKHESCRGRAGMSKVSVIMISYNEREYLEQSIQSVADENYQDLEIIIGDDGSNDGSQELISTFSERFRDRCPVRFYVMERPAANEDIIPSIRVSMNIRKALGMAEGDYVVILSGDDYFTDPDKIREAVEYLDAHPDVSSYVSGYRKVGAETAEYLPLHLSPDVYFSAHYLHISCFVFRKPDPEKLLDRFADDTGLQFTLGKDADWAYSDKITFAYRQRPGSIMHDSGNAALMLLELMIYQDILNDRPSRRMKAAARARMYRPLRDLMRNRESIREETAGKYLRNAAMYPNDIPGMVANWESLPVFRKLGLRFLLFRMGVSKFRFRLFEKICLKERNQ